MWCYNDFPYCFSINCEIPHFPDPTTLNHVKYHYNCEINNLYGHVRTLFEAVGHKDYYNSKLSGCGYIIHPMNFICLNCLSCMEWLTSAAADHIDNACTIHFI